MKILLHICCAVCASSVIERLLCEGHKVTGYFYNPNIHPQDEYKKRLEAARKVAKEWNIDLVEGPYDRQRWFELVKGKEYASEGGERCRICFTMRLKKAFEHYLKEHKFDAFTTTLSVSPLKDAILVNSIGREIGGDERFICADFKKKDGFKRANELSKEWDLYRQHYCGCIYSLEEELAREKTKKEKGNSGKD